MKKEIRKIIVSKIVEEEVDSSIYISEDGTIFDNEIECLKYEDNINFIEYFKNKYLLENIEPEEYGLNFGSTSFCHLVHVNKITDDIINDFIKFYKLEDQPNDLIKLKQGWSFIALIFNDPWYDINDIFIIEPVADIIKNKRNQINKLNILIKRKENEKSRGRKK